MNHAVNQEILLGTPILHLELQSQLMLRHHHTQDMLSIYKLTQLLIPVLTQIKQQRLMNHAVNQEILLGTLIPLLELQSQLMLRLHHIQDMLSIYKLIQQLILVSTQTKLLKLMNHAASLETLLGTLIRLQELQSQLTLKPHHTQDMLFTEELTDLIDQKQFVYVSSYLHMPPKIDNKNCA